MFDLAEGVLEFLLKALDLVLLERVLDPLVQYLLLLFEYLVINRLLVLFPLISEFLELLLDLADFVLEHSEVLALEFLELSEHLLLLLGLLLHALQVLRELLLLASHLLLPGSRLVIRQTHLVHLSLYRVQLGNERGDLLLFFLLELFHVEFLLLLLDVGRLLLALLVLLLRLLRAWGRVSHRRRVLSPFFIQGLVQVRELGRGVLTIRCINLLLFCWLESHSRNSYSDIIIISQSILHKSIDEVSLLQI